MVTLTRTKSFTLKPVTTVGFVADQGGRGFHLPTDFVIRSDGRIFVASRSNTTALDIVGIQMATIDAEFFGQLGGYGSQAGNMIWPSALALDSEDNLYLADRHMGNAGNGRWRVRRHIRPLVRRGRQPAAG